MKRIHYLLLGLLAFLTVAAVSPSLPLTRIIAGSGVTVVTNGVNNYTLSASGSGYVASSNGTATNLSVFVQLTNNGAYNGAGAVKSDGGFRTVVGGSGPGLGTAPSGAYNTINSAGGITLTPAVGDVIQFSQSAGFTNNGAYNGSGVVKSDGGFRTVIGASGIGLGTTPSGSYNTINSAGALVLSPAAGEAFQIDSKTIIAPGTTGNQTIHRVLGRVNIAAGGTSVVVTNQFVTTSSIIHAVAATADATARVTSVVPGTGIFTINSVAVTAETSFSFIVLN